DLEEALRAQAEVRDCVVFGVARGGNAEACAVLLLADGASAQAAVKRANQSLAEFQKIRCWLEWPDEDFPRTSTQKPKLPVIREVAESKLAGKSSGAAAASGTLQELIERIAKHRVELRPEARLEDNLG